MEPDVCIENGSRIRVVVASVGIVPVSNLRDYVELITDHSRIDQSGMSSFYTEHQKSPFTQQPWQNGCLRFKIVVGGRANRSQWEDFQAHRKVHGVIGLVHCPESPDLDAAYERFTDLCSSEYPAAQTRRCFAFNPSNEQVEDEEHDKKRPQMVIFPPADKQTLKHHMQTLMQEFAASLLMAFESRVLLAESMGATLTTPMDSHQSLSSEEVSKAKRRRLERVQKTMGDYSLLAGSPADAISHYATSIELSRHTGDSFWNAGAIEGSICALVVNPAGVQSDILLEDEVRYKYYEVIQLYRRSSAYIFEVEAELKLARFLCRKERGNELSREVSELLSNAVEAGRNLTDVNDQVVLFVEVARIFATLGYERKSAFFSRQVAQYYLVQDSPKAANSALQILLLAAKTYGVHNNQAALLMKAEETITDGYETTEVQFANGWNALQINVLGNILAAAVRAGDPLVAWTAGARLLRNHYPFITPSSQVSLVAALMSASARLPPGIRCPDPALPFVRLVCLPPLTMQTEIIRKVSGKTDWWVESASSGPFIYTPMRGTEASKRSSVTWVVGEPVEVVVAVANPCAFEVSAQAISLAVVGVDFEAFPLALTLPPSTSQLVSLSGVPREPGSAIIRGCFVDFTGVVTEHVFEVMEKLATVHGGALVDPFRGADYIKPVPVPNVASVVVTPSLPLLSARVVGGGDGDVVLYEGEVREIHVQLSNIGTVSVVEAHLTLCGKHGILIQIGVFQAALPLPPGGLVSVPVEIRAGQANASDADQNRKTQPLILVHYSGPENDEYPLVGRQLALPLQLQVRKGLSLVTARLLSMEVPAQVSRESRTQELPDNDHSLVKLDPYRGSWSMRLLELELWNRAEVPFEMQVTMNQAPPTEVSEDEQPVCPVTRIDCNCCSRLLIPLEKLSLDAVITRHYLQTGQAGGAKVDELGTDWPVIRLRWKWGRNSAGELHIAGAIRAALQESLEDVLKSNPLTFGFRLGEMEDSSIQAQEFIRIKMLVTNNTNVAMSVALSVTCRDITQSNTTSSESVLWAGTLSGIEVELPATGEHIHSFSLCFLVPGEYTLVGAAAVMLKNSGQESTSSVCYSGPPFSVRVV